MANIFNKIHELEGEIKELLEAHPEHKEWFYAMRAEIDRQAGSNPYNRCAVACDLMLTKWIEIIPAIKELEDE